jgi:hypothetical protein
MFPEVPELSKVVLDSLVANRTTAIANLDPDRNLETHYPILDVKHIREALMHPSPFSQPEEGEGQTASQRVSKTLISFRR